MRETYYRVPQIFGSNKAKPKPNLNDAISSVSPCFFLLAMAVLNSDTL